MYWVSLRSQEDVVQVNIYLFICGEQEGNYSRQKMGCVHFVMLFLTGKKNKVVVKWSDSE